MQNQVIYFDKEPYRHVAQRRFSEMCGYDRNRRYPQRRVERSLSSLAEIDDQIQIRGIISEFPGECIYGGRMDLSGQTLFCQALEQIPEGHIRKLFLYILTLGEVSYSETSVLNQVYYDIWQTAYMDVARIMLRDYLQTHLTGPKDYLSPSVGPGFYGMDVGDLVKYFTILDHRKIDVRLLESGFMMPAKSFAGFSLVTTTAVDVLQRKDCMHCLSQGKTCVFCQNHQGIQKKE